MRSELPTLVEQLDRAITVDLLKSRITSRSSVADVQVLLSRHGVAVTHDTPEPYRFSVNGIASFNELMLSLDSRAK